MPIYTYRCQACKNVLDRRQSYSDDPLTTCESCGGELRKVLSAPAIVFKGSGFYNTDYRGSNGAADSKEEARTETAAKDSSSKDGASETTKSEPGSTTSSTPAKTETNTPAAAAS